MCWRWAINILLLRSKDEPNTLLPKKGTRIMSAIPKPGLSRRRPITVSEDGLVRMRLLHSNGSLLVIGPNTSGVELADWNRTTSPVVDNLLLKHGALLFRGFDLGEVERFERFALTICSELFNENGEHPRQSLGNSVYTPVFYPPEEFLLWHNENSFNLRWPRKILFGCVEPAATGGETPVVDSRKVYEMIEPSIRERFESQGVMYVRNYGRGLGLDWTTVFQTTDRKVVEAQCEREGLEWEWKDKDRLRTRCVRPAVVRHPQTGEPVWFTQAQHWHISMSRFSHTNINSRYFRRTRLAAPLLLRRWQRDCRQRNGEHPWCLCATGTELPLGARRCSGGG